MLSSGNKNPRDSRDILLIQLRSFPGERHSRVQTVREFQWALRFSVQFGRFSVSNLQAQRFAQDFISN